MSFTASCGGGGGGDGPDKPGPLSPAFVQVAAGDSHSLAIKDDHKLWAWGYDWAGQVGDGNTEDRSAPIQVGRDADWAAVAAGGGSSWALKIDGTLRAWGLNDSGQPGIGTADTDPHPAPQQAGSEGDWVALAGGMNQLLGPQARRDSVGVGLECARAD